MREIAKVSNKIQTRINGRMWPRYQTWHPIECGIFAETVAFNRSVRLRSFVDDKMAMAWLIKSNGTWDRQANYDDPAELKSE